jgi:hypothetical protein
VDGVTAPLIDREVFLETQWIAGHQLSPDGRWPSFVQLTDRVLNVWQRLEELFDWFDHRPTTGSGRSSTRSDSRRPVPPGLRGR